MEVVLMSIPDLLQLDHLGAKRSGIFNCSILGLLAKFLRIEPMLRGELPPVLLQEDLEYCIDLGLVAKTPSGLKIANPIYHEVIPRQLTYINQTLLDSVVTRQWYISPDGSIAVEKLLEDFQKFFRENSESWIERFDYKEAGPQLLLQAYLQRVVNGGGRIDREYGLGRGRTDILLTWPNGTDVEGSKTKGANKGGVQRVVFCESPQYVRGKPPNINKLS